MKNNDILYDPVTAIDESKATGTTAEIFNDIRSTMAIPLITSIWRGLTGMQNNLSEVWSIAKPIYQSGEPKKVLLKMIDQLNLPIIDNTIYNIDLTKEDLSNISQIIKVYNISNGMNLIALSALIMVDFKPLYSKRIMPVKLLDGKFPQLMTKDQIAPKTWNIIRIVNSFGSPSGIDSHVATLWRHLGHWPNFLFLVNEEFEKLLNKGVIEELMGDVLSFVKNDGIVLRKDSSKSHSIDNLAVTTITNYVHTKYQVIRMVVLGNLLQKWIQNS